MNKTKVISISLKESEHLELKLKARNQRMSVSGYLLQTIRNNKTQKNENK